MKQKYIFILTFLTALLSISNLKAQEAITSSGGSITGTTGNISYSIGQINDKSYIGANGKINQGVQQPYEIYIITCLENAKSVSLELSTYPNPTTNYLNLEIENLKIVNLRYQLIDITGKLILNNKIVDSKTTINMTNLLSAIYILKIIRNDKEIKTFKIIKN